MTEFIVSFELITLLYLILLIPLMVFLVTMAYRLAEYSTQRFLLRRLNKAMKENNSLIFDNNQLLRSNLNNREKINRILADEPKILTDEVKND